MTGHNEPIATFTSATASPSALRLPSTFPTAPPRRSFRLLLRGQQHHPFHPQAMSTPCGTTTSTTSPLPELLRRVVQEYMPLQFALLRPKPSRRYLLHQPMHGFNIQCARAPSVLQYVPFSAARSDTKVSFLTGVAIER